MLLKQLLDLNNFRSILCLDGTLPDAGFFQASLPVIAADGAANTLMKMGVIPQLVIGDLDSIAPEYKEKLKTHFHYDQNFCDFEKSLDYLEQHDLLPAIIVGMNGGYLDHILNNINIFMRAGNFFFAPPLCGYVLHHGQSKTVTLPLQTKISMMGIPSAIVSTKGFEWELSHASLTFPGKNSCFNRNVNDELEITVHEGSALILIYATD